MRYQHSCSYTILYLLYSLAFRVETDKNCLDIVENVFAKTFCPQYCDIPLVSHLLFCLYLCKIQSKQKQKSRRTVNKHQRNSHHPSPRTSGQDDVNNVYFSYDYVLCMTNTNGGETHFLNVFQV